MAMTYLGENLIVATTKLGMRPIMISLGSIEKYTPANGVLLFSKNFEGSRLYIPWHIIQVLIYFNGHEINMPYVMLYVVRQAETYFEV